MKTTRYIAEWLTAQHTDEYGEWEPDRDEYECAQFDTLEAAQKHAIAASKKANCIEWCRVTREDFDPDLGIPIRSPAAWDVTGAWVGDWAGYWEKVT